MAKATSVRGSNYSRTLQGRKVEEHLLPELAGIAEDYLYDPIERECVREFKIDNDCNPILYKYHNERLDCTKYCLKNCNPKEIQLLFDNIPDQIEISTIYGGKVSRPVKYFRLFLSVDTGENEFTFEAESRNMKNFSLIYDAGGEERIKVADSKTVSQKLCKFLHYYEDVVSPFILIELFVDRLPVDPKGKTIVLKNTLVFLKAGKNIGFVRHPKEWEDIGSHRRGKNDIIELGFKLGS